MAIAEVDRVNHGRTPLGEATPGQSMSSWLRIADDIVDGRSSQPEHLSEYPQRRMGVTGIRLFC